jgi:hypothetical protein
MPSKTISAKATFRLTSAERSALLFERRLGGSPETDRELAERVVRDHLIDAKYDTDQELHESLQRYIDFHVTLF